jgi:thiamine biosynthesis protein ThiS
MTRSSEPGQLAVTINGVASTLTRGTTLGQLLAQLGIAPERVAVEVNLSVIERSAFHAKALEHGDRVEIVSFVGGGHG